MPGSQAMKRWYALSSMLGLAQGVAFPMPPSTANSPSPTEGVHGLNPRGTPVLSSAATLTTSLVPGNVCGYYYNQTVTCNSNENCLFHSSDGSYPAGLLCCPSTNAAGSCTFWSTCYNSAQVAATPSLSSSANFICTNSSSPYCATATWAQIDLGGLVIGGGCQNIQQVATLYTESGALITSSGTVITSIIAMSTIRWADDNFIQNNVATTPLVTSPTVSPSTTTTSASHTSSPSGHSTPAGVIAGAVVGSVAGVAVIAAAIIFVMRQRRAKQNQQDKAGGDAVADEMRPAGGNDDPARMMKGRSELQGTEPSEVGTESRGFGTEPSEMGTESQVRGTLSESSEIGTESRGFGSEPRELPGSIPVAYELPG